MTEKFDLSRMLLEIQDDEGGDTPKATRLSQEQIQELMTRRKAPDPEPDSKPLAACRTLAERQSPTGCQAP